MNNNHLQIIFLIKIKYEAIKIFKIKKSTKILNLNCRMRECYFNNNNLRFPATLIYDFLLNDQQYDTFTSLHCLNIINENMQITINCLGTL